MKTIDPYALASEAIKLAGEISPLLAGRDPEVVGATLAQLMAYLLAGHFARTRKATDQLREDLLDQWIETLFKLIPPTEAELLERRGKAPYPHD